MHSNKYTLIFTSIITISLGFVLSYAATSLKPRQDINVEIDMKKNILTALGIKPQKSEKWSVEEVQEVYEKSINGIVLGISMTQIDVLLKIILLLVSIGYTLHKWYIMNGKNK